MRRAMCGGENEGPDTRTRDASWAQVRTWSPGAQPDPVAAWLEKSARRSVCSVKAMEEATWVNVSQYRDGYSKLGSPELPAEQTTTAPLLAAYRNASAIAADPPP